MKELTDLKIVFLDYLHDLENAIDEAINASYDEGYADAERNQ